MGTGDSRKEIAREISNVLVLCGGSSPEREVSISSGKNILRALENLKIRSDLIVWDGNMNSLNTINSPCFIALHGSPGEDGTVQRYLESKDVLYTGSDSKSCEITIDKLKTKEYFKKIGAKTPEFYWKPEHFPCVFKPRFGGSSIDVKLCFSSKDTEEIRKDGFFEDYIDGREITISILETENGPVVLPILEIIPKGKFYDYNSKYSTNGSFLIAPSPLNKIEKKRIESFSMEIYKKVGCRGFARIDGIISNGEVYFLEINSIPGMTSTSDLPASAKACGLSMEDVVFYILRSAVRR